MAARNLLQGVWVVVGAVTLLAGITGDGSASMHPHNGMGSCLRYGTSNSRCLLQAGLGAPSGPHSRFARGLGGLMGQQALGMGRTSVLRIRGGGPVGSMSGGRGKQGSSLQEQQGLGGKLRSALPAAMDAIGAKVAAGVMSGVAQAGIFHPWDRALYLAQTNQRKFFNPANWQSPFQGIWQTLILRVTSATVFFPLEDTLTPISEELVGKGGLANFLTGNMAGAINAVALNPAQTVRYRCFSILSQGGGERSFWRVAGDMWAGGGIQSFFKGIAPTLFRDLVFGGVFTAARMEMAMGLGIKRGDKTTSQQQTSLFACDLLGALLATTLSSPFNYARNLIYAAPPGRGAPTTFGILGGLFKVASRQGSVLGAASFLQSELKIGVANLRVAVAMAMASTMYRMYYQQAASTQQHEAQGGGSSNK
mmetsp:Transcript_27324/g.68893  ORF Transcript_27324/g.68893 Transcript_27324/m.68893 type:complete len:422 (+) Transcript_27324:79-1344(+)